jgi:hypothetical protein
MPQPGNVLKTQLLIKGWNEFNVTKFVKSQTDGKASFNVKFTTVDPNYPYAGFHFVSKNGRTDWRPQLVITHTSGVTPPQEPPPNSTSKLPFGSIWLVRNGQWTQYSSAQAAADNAQAGDEIVFGPGRHYQSFYVRKSGTIEKPIVIRGDGTPRPIIDSSGLEDVNGRSVMAAWGRGLIAVEADNITIENLELKDASLINGFPDNAGAVYVTRSGAIVKNTTIRNCYIHHSGNGIQGGGDNFITEFNEVAYNSYPGNGYRL